MRMEDFSVGAFFLAPKEFFTNNDPVGFVRQRVEKYASIREDEMVMCRVVEDVESITHEGSRFLFRVRTGLDIHHSIPFIDLYVPKNFDFSCCKLLSYKEALEMGILWSL